MAVSKGRDKLGYYKSTLCKTGLPWQAMDGQGEAGPDMPAPRPVPKAAGRAGRLPAVMSGTSPDAHPPPAFGFACSAPGR